MLFFFGGFEDATQAQLEAYCTIFSRFGLPMVFRRNGDQPWRFSDGWSARADDDPSDDGFLQLGSRSEYGYGGLLSMPLWDVRFSAAAALDGRNCHPDATDLNDSQHTARGKYLWGDMWAFAEIFATKMSVCFVLLYLWGCGGFCCQFMASFLLDQLCPWMRESDGSFWMCQRELNTSLVVFVFAFVACYPPRLFGWMSLGLNYLGMHWPKSHQNLCGFCEGIPSVWSTKNPRTETPRSPRYGGLSCQPLSVWPSLCGIIPNSEFRHRAAPLVAQISSGSESWRIRIGDRCPIVAPRSTTSRSRSPIHGERSWHEQSANKQRWAVATWRAWTLSTVMMRSIQISWLAHLARRWLALLSYLSA